MIPDWLITASVLGWFVWGLVTAGAWSVYGDLDRKDALRKWQRKVAARFTLCLPVAPLAIVALVAYGAVWAGYKLPGAVYWLWLAAFPSTKRQPDPGTTHEGPYR